jgi:formylglycine-generating enzyme required for sulfatase activity
MSNENQNIISEQQFDLLLNHALLAHEQSFSNEKMTETMAQEIINTPAISAHENLSIIDRLVSGFNRGTKFWLNAFLLLFLLGGTLSAIISYNKPQQNNSSSPVFIPGDKEEKNHPEPIPSINAQELAANPLPVINPAILALIDTSEEIQITQLINENPGKYIPTTLHIPEEKSFAYEDIPTLSEIEKKQTAKDKLKMLKDIANPKKRIYGYVPMSTTIVNGVSVSVQAFYIKNSEVTNLEYRTFLNDLLIQGKYEDYLTAVPVKDGWKKAGVPELETVYFSSIKYNEFPVVNISRKGAELYCNWLTHSLNEAIDKKIIKMTKESERINDVRLPYNVEWICAARAGKDSLNIKYPWEFVTKNVYNSRGCYLCNFNYEISKDHLKQAEECPYQWNGKLKQGGFHRSIITTAGIAIDTLLTAPVYSYNPSDYGQYCMMGNVSEMVWEWKTDGETKKGAALALGGNWNSDVNNVMIEAPEQYKGLVEASAMIGFRPVFTATTK